MAALLVLSPEYIYIYTALIQNLRPLGDRARAIAAAQQMMQSLTQ